MLGTFVKLLCTRLLPLVVVAIAVLLGWLNTFPIPEGTLFTMVYPALKGYVPPVLSGGFRETPVPPLDDASTTVESYKGSFVDLPVGQEATSVSNNKMPQQGIGMCCRYTAYDPESVRRTILWYLKLGGRHIDTAGACGKQRISVATFRAARALMMSSLKLPFYDAHH